MDARLEEYKAVFVNLVRTHMNTKVGTIEELTLWTELDDTVLVLSQLRVSEDEIRRLINEGQVYTNGRRPPPFPTKRYVTPTQAQEIRIMRQRARYNPDEGANAVPRPVAAPRPVAEEVQAILARVFAAHPVPAAAPAAAPAAYQLPAYLNKKDEGIDSKDLEEYKEMMKCGICYTNIKDVRFSPCGHMLCKSCVKAYIQSGENKCPYCQKPFTGFDKVYYAKYLKYKNKYLQLIHKKN
jgi:hypothetical protein